MRLFLSGVSNMLGDIFDCALIRNLTVSLIIVNSPEITRPRTKSVNDLASAPATMIRLAIRRHKTPFYRSFGTRPGFHHDASDTRETANSADTMNSSSSIGGSCRHKTRLKHRACFSPMFDHKANDVAGSADLICPYGRARRQ